MPVLNDHQITTEMKIAGQALLRTWRCSNGSNGSISTATGTLRTGNVDDLRFSGAFFT
jgi:hypothetical protein